MPSSAGSIGGGAAAGAQVGSYFGPYGTAIGAVAGGLYGALTKKKAPPVAPFTPVAPIDAQAEQARMAAGNLANSDSIEALLTRSNRYAQGQASALLEQAVPGYGKLSQSILNRGQTAADHPYDLPSEVQDNLNRIASERGIKVGTAGQTQKFSALRDLGVNMLDYGNNNFKNALSALSTVTGLSPRISPMSPLSFYVTAGQQLGVAGQNAQIGQFNSTGGQMTNQAGYNANTAISNWNNQNMWDAVMQGALAGSGMTTSGTTNKAGTATTPSGGGGGFG